MKSVTVQEAKARLSRLLRAVEEGEQIEIKPGSRPVAPLTPRRRSAVEFAASRDRFAGDAQIASDFDSLARAFGVIE